MSISLSCKILSPVSIANTFEALSFVSGSKIDFITMVGVATTNQVKNRKLFVDNLLICIFRVEPRGVFSQLVCLLFFSLSFFSLTRFSLLPLGLNPGLCKCCTAEPHLQPKDGSSFVLCRIWPVGCLSSKAECLFGFITMGVGGTEPLEFRPRKTLLV